MVAPDLPIGDRIRHYRKGRRQDVVAGLVGIAPDYLSQIERGIKVPSLPILYAIAQELGVPVAALLAERPPVDASEPSSSGEPAVARALIGYGAPRSTPAADAPVLRDRVEAAWRSWQTSPTRFTDAAAALPDLIADVEHAVRARRVGSDAAVRRDTLRAAADVYGLLRSYLRRTGRGDLAMVAADRALGEADFMSGATEDRYPDVLGLGQGVDGGGREGVRGEVAARLAVLPHRAVRLSHDVAASAAVLAQVADAF